MRNPESKWVLSSICNDAVSLHDSFLAAHGTQEESIRNSVIMDQAFDFDNVLENTKLYRKAFLRQMGRSQTRKLELAKNPAATSSSMPGKPRELPVPMESGPTVIPSNFPLSPKGPGNPSLGEGGPNAETKLDSTASDRELTLVPIQRTNRITILPNLTRDHPRFQQLKAVQGGLRNSIDSQSSDDTNLSSDPVSKVSPIEDQESILAPVHGKDYIPNSPYLNQKQARNVFMHVKAIPDKRRNSTESRTTDDTIWPNESISRRASVDDISAANGQGLLPVSHEIAPWLSSVPPIGNIVDSEARYGGPSSSPSSALLRSSGLPTLSEVLERRTVKPYSLFDFWLYMRDIQQSVDYLDFWYVFSRFSHQEDYCYHGFYVADLCSAGLLSSSTCPSADVMRGH